MQKAMKVNVEVQERMEDQTEAEGALEDVPKHLLN